MNIKKKLLGMLTELKPGTYEFTVKKILYVSSGDWDQDDIGDDIIFETPDNEIIIMNEDELRKHNKIASRHSVREGMKLKKVVPESNTALLGLMSQRN